MDRRILTVDWVSRLFSIVGLLGALGIALYLYNESQQATPDATAKAIQEQVAAIVEAERRVSQPKRLIVPTCDRRDQRHLVAVAQGCGRVRELQVDADAQDALERLEVRVA